MTFGSDWGWGADASESRRMFDLYRERGGNFIDTANFYTNGSSESCSASSSKASASRWCWPPSTR
jgi:aryl-alcohol dehydrogenase-like predicted oxidoreductase